MGQMQNKLADLIREALGRVDWSIDREDADIKSIEDLERMLSPGRALGEWAMRAALEEVGLSIPEGPINEETITDAINAGPLAGTGVEIGNIFDRSSVLRALRAYGIKAIAEALGCEGTIEGVRQWARDWAVDEIMRQVIEEAGDMIDEAPDAAAIVRAIKAAEHTGGWNEPRDFSPAGIANRERQARWRAANRGRKVWVLRSDA